MADRQSTRSPRYHTTTRNIPEYIVYFNMKGRCYNPASAHHAEYGGRGIIVCRRWLDSFANFFADMGPRPSPLHTLDRIDNDGPYEPGNCRWATRTEQARNRRGNRLITFRGETLCLKAWSLRIGIASSTLSERLRQGWPLEEALTTPAGQR